MNDAETLLEILQQGFLEDLAVGAVAHCEMSGHEEWPEQHDADGDDRNEGCQRCRECEHRDETGEGQRLGCEVDGCTQTRREHGLDGMTRRLDEPGGITPQMKHVGGRQICPEQSPCDLGRGALHDCFLHPREHGEQQAAGEIEDDDTSRHRDDEILRCRGRQPCGDSRDDRQAARACRFGDDRPQRQDNARAHALERGCGEGERDEHDPLPPAASRNEAQGANKVTQHRQHPIIGSVRGVPSHEAWKAGGRRQRWRVAA